MTTTRDELRSLLIGPDPHARASEYERARLRRFVEAELPQIGPIPFDRQVPDDLRRDGRAWGWMA